MKCEIVTSNNSNSIKTDDSIMMPYRNSPIDHLNRILVLGQATSVTSPWSLISCLNSSCIFVLLS